MLVCQHELQLILSVMPIWRHHKWSDLMAASKRRDPEYQQVSGYVPKQLALKFKGFCTMDEREISEVLTELIAAWVEEREKRSSK